MGNEGINEDDWWTDEKNMLSKFRVLGGWQISDSMSLYAGPTFNYFVSEVSDGSDIASWSIREKEYKDHWDHMWLGLDIGIRFETPYNLKERLLYRLGF